MDWLAISALDHPQNLLGPIGVGKQIFGSTIPFPNIQLFIALLVTVVWAAYVAFHSRTLTSATLVGAYFAALYLMGLDLWGLQYFLSDHIGYGGLATLPAAVVLVAAGVYAVRKLRRPRQAAPLFGIAMVVAILSSQALAFGGPDDWGWPRPKNGSFQYVGIGAIEVELGMLYLACSMYLRSRFRVEAAAAYLTLAWLAPVAFLGGIGFMDIGWADEDLGTFLFFGKKLTPCAPVLLAFSILVLFLATRMQSYFYIICGLCFFDYASFKIAVTKPMAWSWPFVILCVGLALTTALAWYDRRRRVGEDIDDVGERLIRRSRSNQVRDRIEAT